MQLRPDSGYVLARAFGDMDTSTEDRFTQALLDAVASSRSADTGVSDQRMSVLVDLREVQFSAVAGVHCLQQAEELLPPRSVRLVCPDSWPVRRIMTLFGLHRRWPLRHDVTDAVTSTTS